MEVVTKELGHLCCGSYFLNADDLMLMAEIEMELKVCKMEIWDGG